MLREFGEQVAGLRLIPSDEGRFEVTVNGELVFSKARAHRFPESAEVRAALRKRLTAPA